MAALLDICNVLVLGKNHHRVTNQPMCTPVHFDV